MFKDLKIKNLKIIILLVCYLIVFYFLIFKNILKLVEIKELIEQEDIKIGRLNYEKNTVLKALALKKEDFEKEQKKIVKNEEDETKKSFDNIPSLFRYIEDKITKNNINFQNFGRSRREEDKLNLTMTFKGKEKDVKNFFSDIENEDYDINFSSSYLKITVDKSLLEVKSNLVATVLDKKEEVEIDISTGDKNIFQSLNINPKEEEDEENSYSYMRIGDKTYYRVSVKKENKKKNKKTKTKDKGED